MQPPALLAVERGPDDQFGRLQQVSELDQISRHAELAVIILDLLRQQFDPVLCAFQSLGGAHNTDIVPHEAADLGPVLLDDDFFVRIGHAAFVPRQDRGRFVEVVPHREDVARCRLAEDEAFEQGIGREAIGAVQPALGAFTRRPQPGHIGARIQVHHHPAASVVLRGHDRDRRCRHVDPDADELVVNRREMRLHEVRALVADIEMDIIEPEALDLGVDRARDHIAGCELHALRVVEGHEAFARARIVEPPALAAHRFGDEEVLDLEIVETGRVELHHLHVGDARARAPRHRDAIAGRPARRCRELVDPARPAGCQHGCARDMPLDPPRFLVERIDAPHPACGGKLFTVAIGDEIDAGAPAEQGDVGRCLGCLEQRLLHRPAGRIVDMDNPPVRMPAFAGEVEGMLLAVERDAQFAQAIDRAGRALDHEFDRLEVVQPGAGHHRVAHVVIEGVARIEHRRDAALRPRGRAARKPALGQNQHLEAGR